MEANVGPPNLATNTPPLEFFVGQVFDNEEEAEAFLKEYNKRNFTEIRIRSNHKKAMVFTCKHGVKRTSSASTSQRHPPYGLADLHMVDVDFRVVATPGSDSAPQHSVED